jgi:hypothetical protein
VFNRLAGRTPPKDVRNLSRALTDDQVPVDQIPARLSAMGDDAMLMDLGPNLQRQAGALASVPGPAQKQVRDVVAGRRGRATSRVEADVARTVGTGPEIDALKEGIVRAQSEAAAPIYNAIRDVPLEQSPAIEAVLRTPMGQRAMRQARQLAANDGYQAQGLTVGVADYTKRALDDMASSAARSGNNNVARQARNMARAITSAVDSKVPAYKQAREAFAGPAQVLDAIDNGAATFTKETSPPQLKKMLADMSPSERDGYLQGAQSSIEAMMGNAVNDVASLRNTFKKGWNEQKLRILLGDDVADDLMSSIERELTFGNTANVVTGNSETAARQLAQQEVAPAQRNLGSVGITGLILSAFNKARTGLTGKAQPKVNARLAAALSSGARDLDPAMLKQLRRAQQPRGKALIAPAAPALAVTGSQ